MSLEATLIETNELLRQILTAVQSGAAFATPADAPDAPKRGRPRKDAAAPAAAPVATPVAAPTNLTAGQAADALFGHVNTPPGPLGNTPAAQAVQAEQAVAAAAPAPAAAPAGPVSFDVVIAGFTALNKSTAAGHGREGVIAVLTEFLPGDPKPSVPKLAALNRNGEILAAVNRVLSVAPAAPEAAYDPLA
jgi:hypothetical protein